MSETLTAADFAATLGDMIRAAELGGVEWVGPIENVDEWLAGNQQRTDEHGDAGLPGYCVQSSDGEIIVAFTGTGPHAAAYAELIAYLLNNAAALAAHPVPAGPLTTVNCPPCWDFVATHHATRLAAKLQEGVR